MDIVVRVTVIYLFIFFAMRVLDKREFGELAPFELVTLLLIPEIVSDALVGEDSSLTGGLIGIATLILLVFFISVISHLSRKIENVVEGYPAILINHGQLLENTLNVERVNPGDIFTAMHRSGIEHMDQVKWAILESDGKISIIPEEKRRSVSEEEEGVIT